MRNEYIRRLAGQMDVDAVLLSPSEELRFFTGFSPKMCERFQALFIKKDGSLFYLCNELYNGELQAALPDCPRYTWHDNEGMEKVYRILREQGLAGKTVAVNATAQAFNILDIAAHCDIRFVNGKPLLEEVRIRKSPEEMERLRRSAAVADSAFEEACAMIRPGITEGDIRDVILGAMARQGGTDFDCIVASGPNSAYGHYNSFDRVIREGDCIVLDWGCVLDGMKSDLSRTVFVGSITEEQRGIYAPVDRAQLAAEAAAKEGAWIPDIDAAARDILDATPYCGTLPNRVGHGIGYSTHEGPYINQINPRPLERGMCFSIEPGVYLPGRFGMRIENILCINENGETEVLNKADRSLRVLDWWKK
ncbi:MAG: M24 family metallopeptidase [Oscillospiraceae bacterium]